MKRLVAFFLVFMLVLSGCAQKIESEAASPSKSKPTATPSFSTPADTAELSTGANSDELSIEPTWEYPGSDNWKMTGQIGGTTKALYQEGDFLYLGSGLHVLVLNIADSENIRVMGTSPLLPQFIESISGDDKGHLLVSCGSGGLVILNVSNISSPTISGYLDTMGYTENAISYGQYVVLADGPQGVQIVDVSNIQSPTIVSEAFPLAYVYDVVIDGNIAYAAGGGSGLFTVDLSDPLNPKEAGLLSLDGFQYNVMKAKGRLYTAGAWGGVHVLSIDDPLNPVEVANAFTPGWAMALSADDDSLLVLDGADGALLYEIVDEQPTLISAVSLNGYMVAGTLNGTNAFVLDEQLGLITLDYTKKTDPSIISRWMPLLDGRRVSMNGTACYVAGGLSGLHVYDISNVTSPMETLWYDLNGDYVNKALIDGTKLYVASSPTAQLTVFDASDSLLPKRLSTDVDSDTTFGTAFRSLALGNGYVFIPGESADLSVNLNDLQNLHAVSSVPLGNPINGDCRGNMFVSTSNTQIHIVDVSDPDNIRLLSVLDKQSPGEAVRFINDTTLLTAADPGIWIVDVSNPSEPKKSGQIKISGVVMEACIDGTTAYLSCLGDGIQIVDLSDLTMPALIGQIDTLGLAYDCCVSGDTLVVADGNAGLSLYTKVGTQVSVPASATTSVPLSLRTGETPFVYEAALVNRDAPTEAYSVVITSAADSGPGTLREALENLNQNTTITFDPTIFPTSSPAVISLESPLPDIVTDYLTIDASNVGVILDGSQLEYGCGLVLYSSSNIIMGLQILHFPQYGIDLEGSHSIVGGSRETGSGPLGQGNLLSGNGQYGIYVYGSNHTLMGNYIGVDITGSAAMSNWFGVFVASGQYVTVGGTRAGEGNVISGNTRVNIDSWGDHTRIIGNLIGTNATGTKAILESTACNVTMEAGATSCVVGGTTPEERNIISGAQCGFVFSDNVSSQCAVIGNFIGTDISGTKAIPNVSAGGPWSTSHHRIGGTRAGESNLISGNRCAAVTLSGYGGLQNYVIGNRIGLDSKGGRTLPNGIGIEVSMSQKQSAIGGYTPAEGNLIFGRSVAVQIANAGSESIFIAGNSIDCPDGTGVFLTNGARGNFVQNNTFEKGCKYSIWISNGETNFLRANLFPANSIAAVLLTSEYSAKFTTPAITYATGGSIVGTAIPFGLVEVYLSESGWLTSLGATYADGDGNFTFTNSELLKGKQVLLLASDITGNTSAFSAPTTIG